MRTTVVLQKVSAGILGSLSGFRRACWRRRALQYMWGMLLLLRFHSQAELARQTGGEGPDGLQHFLHDSPWDEEAVRAALQRRVAWEARGGGALRLIIDDTVVERR